jgi:hypothetical protein
VAARRQLLVDTDLNLSPTAGYGLRNFQFWFTVKKLSASLSADNLVNHVYYGYLSHSRNPLGPGVQLPEPCRNVLTQLRCLF